MILLHAARVSGRTCLWAEAPSADPGEGGEPGLPPPLPFDAGAEGLLDGVGRAAGGFRPDARRIVPFVAWLPARGRRPIPSSPLVDDPPRGPGRIRLRPWIVAGLALDPEEALTLLASAAGRRTLAPGLPVTADLAFWSEALRLAGRLVAGGHVLPGLVRGDGEHRAVWDPVFRGEELGVLARLSRRMPGAARALAVPSGARGGDRGSGRDDGDGPAESRGSGKPPASSPLALLREFVTGMSDHLVRSSQWPDRILPHPSGGRPSGRRERGEERQLDERWLAGLRAPDPVVEGDARELRDLSGRLEAWRRPLHRLLDAPWRLSFVLEEPGGEGGPGEDAAPEEPWRLRYLLRDVREPGLVLPMEDAWNPEESGAAAVLRGRLLPRGDLLQALGHAARLSPPVAESLEEPEPSGAELDPAAAHRFLREEAPLLREAGFGIHLPAWWSRDRDRLKASIRAVTRPREFQAAAGLNLEALVAVRWEVVLGGEAVPREKLEAMTRLGSSLIRLRDRWVEVDEGELRRILGELDRTGEGEELAASRLVRMAIGAEDGPAGLPVADVRAEGPLGELLDGLRGNTEFRELPAPSELRAELRPYQRRGYSWLAFLGRWGLGACLADDMGLGKTVQTLALVLREREAAAAEREGDERGNGDGAAPPDPGPVLVVCPTSVVTNWEREAGRFTPSLRVRTHHGPDRPVGPALEVAARKADLVVTTYGLLHRDAEDLARVEWGGLVLDEAQNIKNPETRRARAARSLQARLRIALTGTPVENHVGDLWSIMEVLNPGLLGTRSSFRRRFFLPIQSRADPGAAARLRRITGPFILRREKSDRSVIRDLPDRIDTRVHCTLTREQASLYAAVVRKLEEGLSEGAEGIDRKGLVLTTLTRLKQVCNHPAHFLGDGSRIPGRSRKVDRLVELLDEVREGGGRALVFTQYARMGEILKGHLQEVFGREVPFLHGGLSRTRREELVDRFQARRGPEVFLLSLKAGGTGLNLTAANHVFLFDRWWNPAVEAQATDRAYRIGQRKNVQVHRFVCVGTLEERIDRMLDRKREVARRVVGTGEGWLTELSDEELREVLALGPDAVPTHGADDGPDSGEGDEAHLAAAPPGGREG